MREVIILIKNAVGRELPEMIGTYQVRPFAGYVKPATVNRETGGRKIAAGIKSGG